MAQLHENSEWVVNDEARRLHETGLNLEVDRGAYEQAHATFADAVRALDGTPGDDAELQRARIIRDDGFTSVREAVAEGNGGMRREFFEAAQTRLEESRAMTLALFSRTEPKSKQSRELFSEHGATLGTLARMVVAKQVATEDLPMGSNPYLSKQDIRGAQHYFGKRQGAHHYLQQGSNMYYLVSNAMHGARAERLNRNPLHMLPWLGRATVGLARAATGDRVNLLPALKTVGRIGTSLRTKRAATESVKARP